MLPAVSWLCLGIATLLTSVAVAGHWAINAEAFGAHDLGLALTLAFASSLALIGTAWAAPVFVMVGILILRVHRQSAWRILLAAVILAVPILVSLWW